MNNNTPWWGKLAVQFGLPWALVAVMIGLGYQVTTVYLGDQRKSQENLVNAIDRQIEVLKNLKNNCP